MDSQSLQRSSWYWCLDVAVHPEFCCHLGLSSHYYIVFFTWFMVPVCLPSTCSLLMYSSFNPLLSMLYMKMQFQVGEFIWKIHNKYQCMSSQFSSWWSFSPSFYIYFLFTHFYIFCVVPNIVWVASPNNVTVHSVFVFVYILSTEFSRLVLCCEL